MPIKKRWRGLSALPTLQTNTPCCVVRPLSRVPFRFSYRACYRACYRASLPSLLRSSSCILPLVKRRWLLLVGLLGLERRAQCLRDVYSALFEWLRSCTPICREGIDGLERGGGCRADASATACDMFSHSVRASSLRLCENITLRNFINMPDHIRNNS